ncbi:hypothetical protein ABIA39_007478 [Nocardia sp. GAS34]
MTPNRAYAQRFLRELPDSADRILVPGAGQVPILEAPDRGRAHRAEC